MGGHIAHMSDVINAYKILARTPKVKNHLEDIDIDGKIILERILRR
jgi:hypothetical protein